MVGFYLSQDKSLAAIGIGTVLRDGCKGSGGCCHVNGRVLMQNKVLVQYSCSYHNPPTSTGSIGRVREKPARK